MNYPFCVEQIFKMAATATHSLTQNYMGNQIKYGQSLKGHKKLQFCVRLKPKMVSTPTQS